MNEYAGFAIDKNFLYPLYWALAMMTYHENTPPSWEACAFYSTAYCTEI